MNESARRIGVADPRIASFDWCCLHRKPRAAVAAAIVVAFRCRRRQRSPPDLSAAAALS